MTSLTLIPRLALAAALGLSAASLAAFAAEAQDTTEIEITVDGKTEKMKVESLKVGETRQFYSEAGTLVTATRTADSLELDVGGDKTSIKMLEPGDLHEAHLEALIAEGGGDAPRVMRIERHLHDGDGKSAPQELLVTTDTSGELQSVDADGTYVIVKHGHDPSDGGEPHVIVKRLDGKAGSDGKQVIVKRRIEKTEAATPKSK